MMQGGGVEFCSEKSNKKDSKRRHKYLKDNQGKTQPLTGGGGGTLPAYDFLLPRPVVWWGGGGQIHRSLQTCIQI